MHPHFFDNEEPKTTCRGHLYIPRSAGNGANGNHHLFDDHGTVSNNNRGNDFSNCPIDDDDPTPEQLQACYRRQQMNFLVSQLPMAPKCPDAPVIPQRTLPMLEKK